MPTRKHQRQIRACELERLRWGMTQRQFADAVSTSKLRVNQMTISLLERGAEFASRDALLKRLARFLRLPAAAAPRLLDVVQVDYCDDDAPAVVPARLERDVEVQRTAL